MISRRAIRFATLCAVATLPRVFSACSDDSVTDPSEALVGTWNATSFLVGGQDPVAQGMTLRVILAAEGGYTIEITADLIGACSPNPDCTETGTWSATAAQLTLNPGTVDQETFAYTIQGTTLTLTGTIDGTPVTITFTRV